VLAAIADAAKKDAPEIHYLLLNGEDVRLSFQL
jgi:hypothetical protein